MFIIKVNTGNQIGIMLKNTLSTINEQFLIPFPTKTAIF
jgi:hypothetical protein